jgi:ABC-type transporter Mla subunit MlaD
MVLEAVLVVSLALFALLVGAAVPALVQLRRTLRAAQEFFETTGLRTEELIRELGDATKRLNRITEAVEARGRSLGAALDTVRTVGRVIAAVGPAAAAAIRAFAGISPTDGGPEVTGETSSRTASEPAPARKEAHRP